MALHIIPDDGAPHAPTTECGCGPQPQMVTNTVSGITRVAFVHPVQDQTPPDSDDEPESNRD